MQKILLISVTILTAHSFFGQEKTTITGTVLNQEDLPIEHAIIIAGEKDTAFSDNKGYFSLESEQDYPVSVLITAKGFEEKTIIYNPKDRGLKIPLTKEDAANENLSEIKITARRRTEKTQDVPIPITVLSGNSVEDAGAFNVNRVKELVPTVQLYSSNPRNTTLNIRGLGSTFGLTNDGIDPGVGFYIDGVYYARPAATTLDFIDIEQIEVLRGPQGTLFGKNTTAGAFNITTRKPTFQREVKAELSYGNYGYIQAKASIAGPLSKKLAARISFSGTQRNGTLENISTGEKVNDMNNIGFRGQLLYKPSEKVSILFAGDATWQRPVGYAQVVAGVVKTQRAGYRQFDAIIADLGYSLPTTNPFDRVIDHNTTWRSNNDIGGASITVDAKIGKGTLTATSAWRYWNWDPSNDRDFTGLAMLSKSQAPSKHNQISQEVRYAGNISSNLSGVVGAYAIYQQLESAPYHIEEAGDAQWRFAQSSTSPLWQTPGLFDGYGIKTYSKLNSFSGAAFANADWKVVKGLHIMPGIRLNYDQKSLIYNRETYGGLQTQDPALLALKKAVYSDQAFTANIDNWNFSGQLTVSYQPNNIVNAYAIFATAYKPVGLNLGGLPTQNGQVMTELATIKPEDVKHYEIGVKLSPATRTTVNISGYLTHVKDYQTQVQTAELGVNRGYLANAEKVQVWGIEIDARTTFNKYFSLYANLAYTDAIYLKFTNAPVPLEETGGTISFKDISGGRLPGVSKWAGSVGGEVTLGGNLIGTKGKFFLAVDASFRSDFSSSSSPSQYLNIDGYGLLNARLGFRANRGFSMFIWGRNITNTRYFEQLLPGAGNAGHYAAVLGDPVTYGVTVRFGF